LVVYRQVSTAPHTDRCPWQHFNGLGRLFYACDGAEAVAAADHEGRCPAKCQQAVEALRADPFDPMTATCYQQRALLSMPFNPIHHIPAVDLTQAKGCLVNGQLDTFDFLGQPQLLKTYRPDCECDKACVANQWPPHTIESFLNTSHQMYAWNRIEIACSAPWYTREGEFVSRACTIGVPGACDAEESEMGRGAVAAIITGVVLFIVTVLAYGAYRLKQFSAGLMKERLAVMPLPGEKLDQVSHLPIIYQSSTSHPPVIYKSLVYCPLVY
jgi:hypothetical protein